ncbi:NADH-quinone oxidoreductase subunit C/D [Buchnera aphidicola]|uniref:NADH-quinone oxidoreductase subunit D n=1 Tax=Buchnera aphidicola subsp. Tuberolachnus salignus TaxID=98804 RepID=A0A160SWP5_BUCTT|nr:NADH-quinone oxidoreductase subunit C/D [Buchnera aphidicola]CUR53090.1 NADH-quinone oxidoreductase subunit C/D,partial [Buchnera aphidicola (Tuberolachnus salignus)]
MLEYLKKPIIQDLFKFFGKSRFLIQNSSLNFPVFWILSSDLLKILNFLYFYKFNSYNFLFDLHGVDERLRKNSSKLPQADFSVFYHIISLKDNSDIMFKIALSENNLQVPTITSLFVNANWYECETWEMFGIVFIGHPNLRRIIMPNNWKGFPMRKNYPCRATEEQKLFFTLKEEQTAIDMLSFKPKEWGIKNDKTGFKYMFLNLGPNHPSAHGAFRILLQLEGEKIIDCMPDIGYHHRGAEKIAERQTWHNYIPYTDRIEYLGGCLNEMPYILAVEKLANIIVPKRVEVIRIMLSELFRINSHLLFISTFIQDTGSMSTVFLAFTDRQKIYDLIELITGARMHPAWFRIGGVAKDLPKNWDVVLKKFLQWMPKRLKFYIDVALKNSILISRSQGIASYTSQDAIRWGVTGAGLRATGIDFDVRKKRPYSGYQNFEFEIPIGSGLSDAYTRVMLKVEEIYQSLKILTQCLKNMPCGPFKADHPLTTPPEKNKSFKDIETLITHFLSMSWGIILKPNESFQMVEASKGINSYYLISDGEISSYRTRIRTPSFPHLQQIPSVIKNSVISDLIVYLGSIDFVMSDVDR